MLDKVFFKSTDRGYIIIIVLFASLYLHWPCFFLCAGFKSWRVCEGIHQILLCAWTVWFFQHISSSADVLMILVLDFHFLFLHLQRHVVDVRSEVSVCLYDNIFISFNFLLSWHCSCCVHYYRLSALPFSLFSAAFPFCRFGDNQLMSCKYSRIDGNELWSWTRTGRIHLKLARDVDSCINKGKNQRLRSSDKVHRFISNPVNGEKQKLHRVHVL